VEQLREELVLFRQLTAALLFRTEEARDGALRRMDEAVAHTSTEEGMAKLYALPMDELAYHSFREWQRLLDEPDDAAAAAFRQAWEARAQARTRRVEEEEEDEEEEDVESRDPAACESPLLNVDWRGDPQDYLPHVRALLPPDVHLPSLPPALQARADVGEAPVSDILCWLAEVLAPQGIGMIDIERGMHDSYEVGFVREADIRARINYCLQELRTAFKRSDPSARDAETQPICVFDAEFYRLHDPRL